MTQVDEAVTEGETASETREEPSYLRRCQKQAVELYGSTEALRQQVVRVRSLIILLIAVVVVLLVVVGSRGLGED